MRRDRAGFTLLEILVAIGLTAALMLTSYEIFRQITRTQERAHPNRHRDLAAQVFLDRFERELVGATLREKPEDVERASFPWLFLGDDRLVGSEDGDALRFVTQSPARAPGHTSGALRLVSYHVAGASVDDRVDLFRVEESLPRTLELAIPLDGGGPALEDVARFSLRFLNEQAGLWQELWDSSAANADQLPVAIEVIVQLFEDGAEGQLVPGREHLRVIALPVRPIPARPDAGADTAGCSDGPTIQACLARYAEELDSIGEEAHEELLQAASAAGSGCWNVDEPGAELAELHDVFESAIDILALEACQ